MLEVTDDPELKKVAADVDWMLDERSFNNHKGDHINIAGKIKPLQKRLYMLGTFKIDSVQGNTCYPFYFPKSAEFKLKIL